MQLNKENVRSDLVYYTKKNQVSSNGKAIQNKDVNLISVEVRQLYFHVLLT